MAGEQEEKLIKLITAIIEPLGYECVHIEVINRRRKVLRVFIDWISSQADRVGPRVGIEDCVKVSRALDEPLDKMTEFEQLFNGPYELEVSTPGVDRPLRTVKDYERFKGELVRIHVFRPLSAEELGNQGYQAKNPKQKNFHGTLMGVENGNVVVKVFGTSDGETVNIPLDCVSKANLEPKFEVIEKRG